LLVGIWGLVAVMSGSGPMHRHCLTMLIDAVNRSRSAPSTEWRPLRQVVTLPLFASQDQSVLFCQRVQRRPSGPRLRLRGVRGVGKLSGAARLGNAAVTGGRPNVSVDDEAPRRNPAGGASLLFFASARAARRFLGPRCGSDHAVASGTGGAGRWVAGVKSRLQDDSKRTFERWWCTVRAGGCAVPHRGGVGDEPDRTFAGSVSCLTRSGDRRLGRQRA
jgi:hypothetical protein